MGRRIVVLSLPRAPPAESRFARLRRGGHRLASGCRGRVALQKASEFVFEFPVPHLSAIVPLRLAAECQ